MEHIETVVAELRRLLNTPNGANDAWDCFHDELMTVAAFRDGAEPCTHPELVEAVEVALEGLTRERFALENVVLMSMPRFGLVHGAAEAGHNLVLIVFCAQTRRGIIGIPLQRSGQLMLLHISIGEGLVVHVGEAFPMAPANC